jgi:excisionase family DNA binding protein
MLKPDARKNDKLESGPVSLFDNTSTAIHPCADLLTIREAAVFLRISQSGVRRLQQGRHLSFIKVGGSVRFARSDLCSYLAKRRVVAIDL